MMMRVIAMTAPIDALMFCAAGVNAPRLRPLADLQVHRPRRLSARVGVFVDAHNELTT